ncbi:hypothetical protein C8F01DRAFT_1303743 [Mycena amicta]|nr:hypothetical protein C8F01DRAFT_1303743 [Mycena amicta]
MAITPYPPIILSTHGAVGSWIYPVVRIAGSVLCAVCTQFTLQQRIRRILRDNLPNEGTLPFFNSLLCSQSLLLWALRAALALGSVATAVGYLGCFNLVQTASTHETLLWLGLEAALCLIHIFVWSINPKWDEDIYATLTETSNNCFAPIRGALAIGVELPWHFTPRKLQPSPQLSPTREPWIWSPLRYMVALSQAGDSLYLFTVCFPNLSWGSDFDTTDAFVFIQRMGHDSSDKPMAFYEVHALTETNTPQAKFQLGKRIKLSEVVRRFEPKKSRPLGFQSGEQELSDLLQNMRRSMFISVSPLKADEYFNYIVKHSGEILNQLPDPTSTAQEMSVNPHGFR